MATILIADDDARLRRMLQRTLVYEGFDVEVAADGREALDLVQACHPDLIVLDWMMPGDRDALHHRRSLDGIEVVQRLRSQQDRTMVLMLTARDAIENRVEGLQSGADDYLVKPFAPAELVARVHALLRRSHTTHPEAVLAFSDLTLDPNTRQANRAGRAFDLTPTEYSLLELFLRHPRQVLEREQLLTHVWGYDFEGEDNVLEVYVGYLRKKTEAGGAPRLIQTVRGIGYVLRTG
jgi:two-component system response regulator MprA